MVFISMEQFLNNEMIVELNAGKLSVYSTEACDYTHEKSWRIKSRVRCIQFCMNLIYSLIYTVQESGFNKPFETS